MRGEETNSSNNELLARQTHAFKLRVVKLHSDFERSEQRNKLLQRDLSKAESIAKGLKIKNDECVREIEKMGSEVRVQNEALERTKEKTKTLESNRDALELVVKETQSELYSVKEEAERRIRQLTMEQSTSERAERALDDAAVAFSGERRDADDEMRRHIERRLEVENEREKCLNALEEKERKWEKERRERDAKEGKLTRENEQLTSENEKRKDQIKSLEEECRKANAALRERSADMALAVKKLNVELKQQRLETEKGMAKRVEALRVAFGNAIEDVKEEAKASLSRKDEEIARILAKEVETNTRMASVEKHCLKVRDALLELGTRKNPWRKKETSCEERYKEPGK
ncbi:unnamed protein product [Bathycoccus prasinos]